MHITRENETVISIRLIGSWIFIMKDNIIVRLINLAYSLCSLF